jgi:PTS system nitrogen regulatory IIA component
MMSKDISAIMTAEDVAKYLKITPATVYRLAQKGELPGAKIGRVWRFRKEAIDNLLQEQESMQAGKGEREE